MNAHRHKMTAAAAGIAVLLVVVSLVACSKRLAELKLRYPVTDGRHTILDEESLQQLDPADIEGLYIREINALMGEPVKKNSYFERKEMKRYLPAGTVPVRSDDWFYDSNNGAQTVRIKFENKEAALIEISDKQGNEKP